MSPRITLVSVMQYTFLLLILQHGVSNMFSVGAKRAARMVFVGTRLTDRGEKKRFSKWTNFLIVSLPIGGNIQRHCKQKVGDSDEGWK